MGGCIQTRSISKQHFPEAENTILPKKIIVLGLPGSGKTSLIDRLSKYQIKSLKETITPPIDDIDAVIYMISSTSSERQLLLIRGELMLLNKDLEFEETVVLVLFNKIDSPQAQDISTIIDEVGINNSMDVDLMLQRCSTKTGEGIHEAIDKVSSYFANKTRIANQFIHSTSIRSTDINIPAIQ